MVGVLALLLACTDPTPAVDPAVAPPEQPTQPTGSFQSESGAVEVHTPPPATVLGVGPFEVAGAASVWEGRLNVRLLHNKLQLDLQHVSATTSAPARGDWSATLTAPEGHAGPAVVEAWTTAAKDGAPENLVRLPVVLSGR